MFLLTTFYFVKWICYHHAQKRARTCGRKILVARDFNSNNISLLLHLVFKALQSNLYPLLGPLLESLKSGPGGQVIVL